jgi:HK97 family phage prohead protease
MTRAAMVRSFKTELEATEGRMVEGCVVPYGEAARVQDLNPDGTLTSPYWEAFEPGAFRKQIKAASRVELRYEHRDDLASSIGICRSLHDEAAGLFGSFRVHEGPFGDQALELVREGVLPGFSVEFEDRYRHWFHSPEGTVLRRSCELLHVGLTRSPAYPGALAHARSRQEWETELELPPVDEAQLERLRALGVVL